MMVDQKNQSKKFFSKKKVTKPLDISPKIRDNTTKEVFVEPLSVEDEIDDETEVEVVIEDEVEDMTPEEIEEVKKEVEREINTQAVRGDGWLDDVDDIDNTKKVQIGR